MRPELAFEFLVDKDAATMTIRRAYAAPRALVWDCYARSDLLDRWFSPKPLTTRTASMDFRPGGHWHYAMIMPDGQEFWGRLDYQTINATSGFTALDGFCDETGALTPGMARSEWDVTFVENQGQTTVQTLVRFDSAADLQQVIDMGMQEGMTSTMEKLDELLAALTT